MALPVERVGSGLRKYSGTIHLRWGERTGLGRGIMDRVMQYIRGHAVEDSFIGLMAAKDVAAFYERYGFQKRPADRPGMYMMWRA